MTAARTRTIDLGESTVSYTLILSARRRKTLTLAMDAAGNVRVMAPVGTATGVIEQFLRHRAGWIQQHAAELAKAPAVRAYESGDTILYRGRTLSLALEVGAGRTASIRPVPDGLCVSVPSGLQGAERAATVRLAVERWYRREAEEHLCRSVERWSAVAGVSPAAVFVRDQRHRWGSCSPDGSLRFNWRLVMAESEVLDYVVVHELAHLTHRNHSKAFWGEVARIMPGFEGPRARLRETGHELRL